nr:MAG TPA_asm: hypothetical protein [Bacteriophage sp.]
MHLNVQNIFCVQVRFFWYVIMGLRCFIGL